LQGWEYVTDVRRLNRVGVGNRGEEVKLGWEKVTELRRLKRVGSRLRM
jgi:hypothetical protein